MRAGVTVNLILWDEIDSKDNILVYTVVEKKLHGGGAPAYFKASGVSVKLAPRVTRAKQVSNTFNDEASIQQLQR